MSEQSNSGAGPKPMGARKAFVAEMCIIGLCIAALVMVFQPFSLTLFSVGCGLVIVGGLAFNLVPMCRAEVPLRSLFKSGLIVLVVLLIVTALAIGAAKLYGLYLIAERG